MKAFLNFCLFGLALIGTVLLADIFLRWYLKIPYPLEAKQIIDRHPELKPSKRLRKNFQGSTSGAFNEYRYTATIGEDGFRRSPNTPAGPYEIIFLGDSQTFGVGVNDDETFVSRTGALLKKPVLNSACPGYNNIEEFQLAEELLGEYRPKYMALCFFTGNDLSENYGDRARFLKGEGGDVSSSHDEVSLLSSVKSYIVKHSSIYNLLIRLRRFKSINELFYQAGLVKQEPPHELTGFKKGKDVLKDRFWEITEKVFLELKQLADMKSVQLVIVIIPDKYQVEDSYWSQWVQKYRLDESEYDRREPNRRIEEFCQRNSISCIDTTEVLKFETLKGNKVYWPIDSHLNPVGHERIAEALRDFFNQNLSNAT